MATELKDLAVEEVSLVDRGANRGARILLLKRKKGLHSDDKGGMMKDLLVEKEEKVSLIKRFAEAIGISKDDLDLDPEVNVDRDEKARMKAAEEQEKRLADLERRNSIYESRESISKADSAEAVDAVLAKIEDEAVRLEVTEAATARKTVLAEAVTIAEVTKYRESLPEALRTSFDKMDSTERATFMKSYTVGTEDPVAKALETVTAANVALVARLDKLDAAEEVRDVKVELKSLEGVVEDFDVFTKNVVGLRKSNAGAADAMIEQMKALAAQAAKGKLFDEKGSAHAGTKNADVKINAAVKKYVEENPGVTPEAAMAKVLEADPSLYDDHLEEKEEAN